MLAFAQNSSFLIEYENKLKFQNLKQIFLKRRRYWFPFKIHYYIKSNISIKPQLKTHRYLDT